MYLAQLANSPPKQFRASQKNPKHGKGGGGSQSRAETAKVGGEGGAQVSAAVAVLCVKMMLLRAAGDFLLPLLSKSFHIHVSSFLILQLLLRPCGYSADQRASCGLEQPL